MNAPTETTPCYPHLNTALRRVNPGIAALELHDEATERLSKAAGILDMIQGVSNLPPPLADALWTVQDLIGETRDVLDLLLEKQRTE